MSNKPSTKFSGFCKNCITQYCLTYMLEISKNRLNKGKYVGDVFMGPSKAFDTINHVLLIAKMEAYCFSNNAQLFILSYLENRSQRGSINSSFSTWEELTASIPQGSILRPLFFSIFLNDNFQFQNRSFLSNYADLSQKKSNKKSNIEEVKQNLSQDLLKLSEWFHENCLILRFCGELPEASELENVLEIQIVNKLNLENHIKSLFRKASQKLRIL